MIFLQFMSVKKRDAFSLIELILVLALISIFFSLVAPRLGGTLGNVTLKSCARDLAVTLNFAHYSAIYKGVNYRVNYDLDNEAFWVSAEVESSVYQPVIERWGEKRFLFQGINLRDVTTVRETQKTQGLEYTNFSPSGRGEKCMVYLDNNKGEVFTVIVSRAMGNARVLDYDYKNVR